MPLFVPITFRNIPNLLSQGVTDGQIRDVLIRVAQRFTPILQRGCPVDTGRLKRSLRVELLPDDSGVSLTSEVFYAGFVEFGTRKMRPRGYAVSIVPDLIAYANLLLGELGRIEVQPIIRVGVGEQSGDATTQVTERFLSQIKQGFVKGQQVQPIQPRPEIVESLGVGSEFMQPIQMESERLG